MKKNTLVASVLLLCAATTHAQLEKNLDSLVSPQFRGNVPGVVILVAKRGQIVYRKAFGNANIELQTPLSPDMVFRIGSITKQFTAVAILQLVEQGKISLRDSVRQYVPFFPPKGHSITIENLLTHTSGIRDYSSKDSPEPFIDRWDFTPEWIINHVKDDTLEFQPGTKYAYSNTNYALLGYVIQKASGKPYHQYMAENVLQRADLTHTEYAPENTIVPGRVQGYTRDKGFYENCDYQSLSLGFACGDLLSNVDDLYKWNQALLSYKLIQKETLKKALTPYKLADGHYSTYGYGWFIDSLWGKPCIHHEGQTSGFIAEEKYFPNEDLYVAVLTNVKSSEDKTDFSDKRFWLFQQIAYVALDIHAKDVPVSESLLKSYTGTYRAAQKHSRTCTITEREGKLYYGGDTQNRGFSLALAAQSDTVFLLPGINPYPTTAEFIRENGKVTKFIVTQGGKYEWDRVSP